MAREFRCYGEGSQLFKWVSGEEPCPNEAMFEGVAGCGKSRIWGEWLALMCQVFPGSKHLVLRQTRVSLNDSWLDIWEGEVLGPGHPALEGPRKHHRSFYEFPAAWGIPIRSWCRTCQAELEAKGVEYVPKWFHVSPQVEITRYRCQRCQSDMGFVDTGPAEKLSSVVVLGGMDNATRLFSTQYNSAYWNEMQEGAEEDWESLHRALRRRGTPFRVLGGDCNPDAETHWANRRAGAAEAYAAEYADLEEDRAPPRLHRIVGHFTDNPVLDQDAIDRLFQNTTGVRLERLAKGRWVSAEGAVWPGFKRSTHVLLAEIVHTGATDTEPYQGPVELNVRGWEDPVRLEWFLAGLDFGFSAPGCLGVWGFDRDGTMYEVAEVYRTGWDLDQWAEIAAQLYREFPFKRLICDHEPRSIQHLNDRLGPECGRGLEAIAEPWVKTKQGKDGEKAGIDVVRVRMKEQGHGRRGIYWLAGNIRGGVDRSLLERKRPLCTVDEIPGYVYPKRQDGKEEKDEPDKACVDHGCDQTRAVAFWVHLMDLSDPVEKPRFAPDSYGAKLRHAEVFGE